MLDFAKKGIYVGLGLAHYTKEKVDAFAKEFAERAKLTEEEGRKFADYLNEESKRANENLRENVESMVEKALGKMPCMSRVKALEARVDDLEKQVKQMRDDNAEEADAAEDAAETNDEDSGS